MNSFITCIMDKYRYLSHIITIQYPYNLAECSKFHIQNSIHLINHQAVILHNLETIPKSHSL